MAIVQYGAARWSMLPLVKVVAWFAVILVSQAADTYLPFGQIISK